MKKLVILILILFGNSFLKSQSNVATTIGQFLLIEPSARLSGMGNSGVAIDNDVMGIYYNPGAISSIQSIKTQITHSNWLAGINYNYAIVALPINELSSISLNLSSLRSGDILVRTLELPNGTGEYYSANDFSLGIGYGSKLTDRVNVGMQIFYFKETIKHSELSGVGLNLGTQYRLTDDGIILGASLSNFGTRDNFEGRDLRIRYDQNPDIKGDNSSLPAQFFTEEYGLPILFRVGLQVPVLKDEKNKLIFAVDAIHPNNNTESINIGGEYTYSESFSIRGGLQNLFEKDSDVSYSFGAGFVFELVGMDLFFDYSWTKYQILGNVQRTSLGFSF